MLRQNWIRVSARSPRRFALAAVAFASLRAMSAEAQPITRGEVERFAERLSEAGEAGENGRTRAYVRVWEAMDSIALGRLNAGERPEALGERLTRLPGYAGASAGDGVQVGRTTFYSQLPREAPNYLAAPVRICGETVVLGIYSLMHNTPGRLSVYARRGGRWRRTGSHDAGGPLSAYLLPMGDTALGVVMIESFTGADRTEGRVRLWRLTPAGLRPLGAERGRLVDYGVEAKAREIAVSWDSFPKHLAAPTLGARLAFRTTYRARGGRIVADTVSLRPWMEALENLARHRERGETARARAFAASEEVYRRVAALVHGSSATEEGGDLDRGEGWVAFYRDRVVVRRGADGRWRAVAVQPAAGRP